MSSKRQKYEKDPCCCIIGRIDPSTGNGNEFLYNDRQFDRLEIFDDNVFDGLQMIGLGTDQHATTFPDKSMMEHMGEGVYYGNVNGPETINEK